MAIQMQQIKFKDLLKITRKNIEVISKVAEIIAIMDPKSYDSMRPRLEAVLQMYQGD